MDRFTDAQGRRWEFTVEDRDHGGFEILAAEAGKAYPRVGGWYEAKPPSDLPDSLKALATNALVPSVVVLEDFTGHGLGSALAQKAHDEYVRRGAAVLARFDTQGNWERHITNTYGLQAVTDGWTHKQF